MAAIALPSPRLLPSARTLGRWAGALIPNGRPMPPPGVRTMRRHEMHWLRAARGARVECVSGCVWVTVDGDPNDIVLEAGEAFAPQGRGRVLVHALQASQVRCA